MKNTLGIRDASEATGFTQRQLRSYEEKGYINPPLKITCGEIRYRRYTPEHIEELKAFKRFIDDGFTLLAAADKALQNPRKEEK